MTAARTIIRWALVAGLLALAAAVALGAAGDLDPGFDGDGTRTIDLGGFESARDVVIQPDGKLVVAGTAAESAVVLRLNPDGSLDPGFEVDGLSGIDAGGVEVAEALALQPDGKVVVAGSKTAVGGTSEVLVARLNADGLADAGFGGVGLGRRTIGSGGLDYAEAVALQPDGKILIAGTAGPEARLLVARLNPDGSNDAGFGQGGAVGLDFGGNDVASAVSVQRDGKIVVAGTTSAGQDVAVARLAADGSLDAGFGTGGRRVIDYGGIDGGRALALQPDGKILIGGFGSSGTAMTVARLKRDGSFDARFDGDGIFGANLRADDRGLALSLQPDGKIVLAGHSGDDVAIARVQPGGGLDTTFDRDGRRTIDLGGADRASGVALRADGGMVLAGNAGQDAAILRLQGDPGAAGAGPRADGPAPRGGSATPRCRGRRATIVGTAAPNALRGTDRADVIVGLGGDDVVRAGGGADVVCGGDGADRLIGGPGSDRLVGGAGRDRCLGGPQPDRAVCEIRRGL
jgi:uncharacterized delta-60 repeat protein